MTPKPEPNIQVVSTMTKTLRLIPSVTHFAAIAADEAEENGEW